MCIKNNSCGTHVRGLWNHWKISKSRPSTRLKLFVILPEAPSEAPWPGGENVEDVAPSYGRVWAPRPEIFQDHKDHMIAIVKALRRPSMLAILTMPIHVPFQAISTCWIILVCDCCLQCPHLEAADAIHAQGDVGASQATQRDNMFRLGLHLKNV